MSEVVPQRVMIVTGLCGAGKTTALKTFEDLGWEVVDNIPVRLFDRLLGVAPAAHAPEERPLAIGLGSATRGFDGGRIVAELARSGHDVEIVFLDCADAELEHRFSATRHRHPLALDRPAALGIAEDRRQMAPLRARADHLIDTTGLTSNALQAELRQRFGSAGGQGTMTLAILSFAFSRGLPRAADLVFDMRYLRNPHWDVALRPLTGRDPAVADYIAGDPAYEESLERIEGLLNLLLPRYAGEGKSYVTVAFGCTGGKHRSVHAAERVAALLRCSGFSLTVQHRDLAHAAITQERPAGEHGAGGIE
ncbi:RNase adapter RapZ [Sphingomonas quercus]|uniref:RNase adapter RapZ n=1 Tax=Sphingomonas quercus TaxID=2842451 RepID=A0ABS6BH86_9SPHN|nr:RNase adapter RapZ [Sphingomonas quercus]MBU3076600.1 RNase adapter RapZ [Sphingomonas quercus]